MAKENLTSWEGGGRAAAFETTRWSAVLQAGEASVTTAQAALEKLCHAYWYPLYAHVRRAGWREEDAKDLTQEFLARFLARKYLQIADPERGRFRSFRLTALKNFLANEWEKVRAQKRGGQHTVSWDDFDPEARYRLEPTDSLSPDRLYAKRWAATLLDGVLLQLQTEYRAADRLVEFDQLKSFVWGNSESGSYAEVAARLQIKENALKVAVHRLRKRFREQLRQEVARTVSSPAEIEDELRYLMSVMCQ